MRSIFNGLDVFLCKVRGFELASSEGLFALWRAYFWIVLLQALNETER